MRYIDLNDEEGTVPVGARFCGIGFKSVTVTYEDVANPHFLAWFFEHVHCRFINPPTKGSTP